MQENHVKYFARPCLLWMLTVAAFLFSAGCSGKTEEQHVEEYAVSSDDSDTEQSESADEMRQETETEEKICVYVCGAVNNPGVYEISSGSRVFEAVDLAGGMTGEAAVDAVNLARLAEDGEQIYIPLKAEIGSQGTIPGAEGISSAAGKKKVNINTASLDELMTLTGIGESKAQSIIRYREENGAFKSIEGLMEVGGIKEGVFEKIKDDITI